MARRELRELEAARDAHLVEDHGEMMLDRRFAEGEALGDLPVRPPHGDHRDNLEFAACQAE